MAARLLKVPGLLALLFLAGPPSLSAHQIISAFLYLDVQVLEEEVVIHIEGGQYHFQPLAGKTEEELADLATLLPLLENWFSQRCPVLIDGEVVPPQVALFEVTRSSDDLLGDEPVEFNMCYTQLRYSLTAMPHSLDFTWTVFPRVPPFAPDAKAFLEEHGGLDQVACRFDLGETDEFYLFTQTEPQFIWRSGMERQLSRWAPTSSPTEIAETSSPTAAPTTFPLLSLAIGALGILVSVSLPLLGPGWKKFRLGGLAFTLLLAFLLRDQGLYPLPALASTEEELSEAEALEKFLDLHERIYLAFGKASEEEIYSQLASTVSGELLDRLFLETYGDLILQEEGGARARVSEIEILEATAEKRRSQKTLGGYYFQIPCHWRVRGIVEHWGHIHERTNEYRALFELSPIGPEWRITESLQLAAFPVKEKAPAANDPFDPFDPFDP
ncbi:MAG: hypothetical protein AAF555_04050 [Verrucomicrobiota bacterium]